jgi:hypothetical protein
MRWLAILLVALPACASGSRAPRACAEPHPDFLRAGEVYAECAVDQKAEIRVASRPDMSGFRPAGATACLYADIDVVVDSAGFPLRHTAKVTRTNDSRYADIVMAALSSSTFYPAKKAGRPVKQLFRYSVKAQMMSVVVPAGSSPSRPSAALTPPC